MKKTKSKNFTAILSSILVTFTIYTGALLIFLYVRGWRFDFTNQSIKQIGVLTVESSPILADIYVNGEHKGRTNKSMTLDVGTYDVKVSKDGYYDWNKEVEILEEKSTPVFPYLVLTDFSTEKIYTSDLKLNKYWNDETNNHLFLLFEDKNSFKLVHYDINTAFWAINTAPTNILTMPKDQESTIENIGLQLSPSGEKAILTLSRETSTNKYVIPTTRSSNFTTLLKEPLLLDGFKDYEINWSKSEDYLILESKDEVISYDYEKNVKNLLLKKTDSLDTWSTDKAGKFYILKHIKTTDSDILEYSLKQYDMNGSNEKIVIKSIYFQNNIDFIENYRISDFKFSFFTNSPESTQTIGEITNFSINNSLDGIYIKTTQASYWYDSTTQKYMTVSPFPADLLYFAPDGDKLLIKTPSKYQMFVFDKEEGDHTITIGTHDIENVNFDEITNIRWLSNSSYFQFDENEFIYLIDQDGNNKTPLISNENVLYWIINDSREKLITLTNTEEGTVITSYKIH
jgi:hypothetical protein